MPVMLCAETGLHALQAVLGKFGISIQHVAEGEKIPGTWFGEPEAGIIGNVLYVREDTPLHSALHESCHYICMDANRRAQLDTNAGGDYDEENGVNYLSILLADFIPGFGRERMLCDMDEWGYTFRLGSSRAWFEKDSDDTFRWLINHGLMDAQKNPLWKVRQ
jgi:hypothetical protein